MSHNRVLFVLASMFMACGSQAPVENHVSAPRVPQESTQSEVPEPDRSLATPDAVADWRMHLFHTARVLTNPFDPATLDVHKAAFKVTDKSVHDYVYGVSTMPVQEETPVQDARVPIVLPSAQVAVEMEALGEHFMAGLVYLQLGDNESAARCMRALESKLEWHAVAKLAIGLHDKPSLLRAVDKMSELGWEWRLQYVVKGILLAKDFVLAQEVAKRCGWDLWSGNWDESLEATGDAFVLKRLVSGHMARWIEWASRSCRDEYDVVTCQSVVLVMGYEACEAGDNVFPPIGGILRLAEVDREGAMEIARTFLASRYANVVSIRAECSEGGEWRFVDYDLKFFDLIAGDPSLKEKYLERTRSAIKDSVVCRRDSDTREEFCDWNFDAHEPPPHAFFARLKEHGDAELVAVWRENLALMEKVETGNYWALPPGTSALNRYLMGLPDGSLNVIDPFLYGEIEPAELQRIWREIGLYTPPAGVTLASLQAARSLSIQLEAKGYDDQALALLANTLTGTNISEMNISQMNMSTRRHLLEMWITYLAIQEDSSAAREEIAKQIVVVREEGLRENQRAPELLRHLLSLPYRVADHNRYPGGGAVADVTPVTRAQAHEMLVPILIDLAARYPAVYERALVLLAQDGDRAFLDDEVERRTQSGDLDAVHSLLAQIPRNLQ